MIQGVRWSSMAVNAHEARQPTCERISATHDSFDGAFLWKQYTRLYAWRSCAMMTFSDPLTMKYPPWDSTAGAMVRAALTHGAHRRPPAITWSKTHSPLRVLPLSSRPFNLQRDDLAQAGSNAAKIEQRGRDMIASRATHCTMMGIMPNHSRVFTASPSGSWVVALKARFSTSM